jgi:predicted DNA-binding protein
MDKVLKNERKSKRISFRVTPSEGVRLEKLSSHLDKNVSDLVRMAIDVCFYGDDLGKYDY